MGLVRRLRPQNGPANAGEDKESDGPRSYLTYPPPEKSSTPERNYNGDHR